jgi:hypothetical protein
VKIAVLHVEGSDHRLLGQVDDEQAALFNAQGDDEAPDTITLEAPAELHTIIGVGEGPVAGSQAFAVGFHVVLLPYGPLVVYRDSVVAEALHDLPGDEDGAELEPIVRLYRQARDQGPAARKERRRISLS